MKKKVSDLPYGLSYRLAKGIFEAKVPRICRQDGYERKVFSAAEYGDKARAEAEDWITLTGLSLWGYRRWELITEGKLCRMWKDTHSVVVQPHARRKRLSDGHISEYHGYRVRWYEGGAPKSKEFYPEKPFGTMEQTLAAANLFAAKQRAIHTGGELNLPLWMEQQFLENRA